MLLEMRIRAYSERTVKTYVSLALNFIQHVGRPVEEISTEALKEYIYYRLKKDGISVSTINQTISAWRIVIVHIQGKEWEGCRIQRPRQTKKLPELLSQQEARELINTPKNLKHRAMLHLLYSTGMRKSELLALKIRDIDSSRMIIIIRQGKGKKDRHVILHPKILQQLRDYYRSYRPEEYLFEGIGKNNRAYSATSLTKIVKRATKDAGISKNISVHTLRHCYATHMLEKGANIKVIQQLLGHSTLRTTTNYLSLVNFDKNTLPNPLDSYEES